MAVILPVITSGSRSGPRWLLYKQALLALGDPALAERVVRDVIVEECALAPVPGRGEDDARYRLAESVFRCCHQLAADPAQRDRLPAQRPPGDVSDRVDPGRLLSEYERGSIGLVLFGGLGYVRASSVLVICPGDGPCSYRWFPSLPCAA